jgi:hypothetical protein
LEGHWIAKWRVGRGWGTGEMFGSRVWPALPEIVKPIFDKVRLRLGWVQVVARAKDLFRSNSF